MFSFFGCLGNYRTLFALALLLGCNPVGDPLGGEIQRVSGGTGGTPRDDQDTDRRDAGGRDPADDVTDDDDDDDSNSPKDSDAGQPICKPTTCANDVPLSERDTDGDGELDVYDTDDDGDGIEDRLECAWAGTVGLVNGDFEVPFISEQGVYQTFSAWEVPGWLAVPAGANLELWTSGHMGVPASEGRQFAELNVDFRTGIYQDFVTAPESRLRWIFAHRGRVGADSVRILIGTPDDMVSQGEFVTDAGEWQRYAGVYEVPEAQEHTRILFEAVSGESEANLIDHAWIEPQCEVDTDSDGCVDSEDPDPCPPTP